MANFKKYFLIVVGLVIVILIILAVRNVLDVPVETVDQSRAVDIFYESPEVSGGSSEDVIDKEGSEPISLPEGVLGENGGVIKLTPVTPQAVLSGRFVGLEGHQVSGKAVVYSSAEGDALRFEDFSVEPGPDYFVYLSKDEVSKTGFDAKRAVSLGEIKSNEGEQTYVIPEKYSDYSHVVIWCRLFSVLIAEAPLGG